MVPGLGTYSIYTHCPKDRNCDIWLRTNITRASCRRRTGTVVPKAENVGVLLTAAHKGLSEESESRNNQRYAVVIQDTADHKVLGDNCESRNNHRYAVVVQDLATQRIQSYPCKTKTSQETQKSLMKYLEPTRKPKVSYTDNSLEFGKSCEELSWHHSTSTPHRSETNGIAERAVRRLKEATSAVLLQSGLDEKWWAESMECNCYLRNIQDLLSDGRTPYERRFGIPFNGPVTPFGAMVEDHPISAKDQSRLHQFGTKVLPGIFLGSVLYAGESGKETLWLQTLKMDASELNATRPNAKEVLTPLTSGNFIFLFADGTVQIFG